jgi:hypothetical protein
VIAALLAADLSSATAPATLAPRSPSPPSAAPAGQVADAPARADNAVFAELLGNGLLYSVNYERIVAVGAGVTLGIRAGASFITYGISSSAGAGNLTLATVPVTVSYYWGPSSHKLQLGLGASALYVSAATDSTGQKFSSAEEGLGIAATAIVGYRYLPARRGVTFGVGFTPLLRSGRGFLPWGGASIGVAF